MRGEWVGDAYNESNDHFISLQATLPTVVMILNVSH
jgi:hypothetical protein